MHVNITSADASGGVTLISGVEDQAIVIDRIVVSSAASLLVTISAGSQTLVQTRTGANKKPLILAEPVRHDAQIKTFANVNLVVTTSGAGDIAVHVAYHLEPSDVADTVLTEAPVLTIGETGPSPQLSWTQEVEPPSNAIWRSQNGGAFTLLDTVSGATTTFTDPDTMSGTDYWSYKIIPAGGEESNVADAAFILQTGATANYPSLIVVYGTCYVGFSTPATSVNLPALKYVGEDFIFEADASLAEIELPALLTITRHLGGVTGGTMDSIAFPVLTTIGEQASLVLWTATSVSFDALTSIGDLFDLSNTTIGTLNAPVLATIGNTLSGVFMAGTTLSLPALVTVTDLSVNFSFSSLVTVSFASWVIEDGQFIDFTDCALNAASVNGLLARGVASTITGATFELAGGTNAAPTGQGITDKATLQGQGNTVNTN